MRSKNVSVISVSVPKDLIDKLDAYEETRGCGRSRIVTELIERFISSLTQRSLGDDIGSAQSDLERSHFFFPTETALDVKCPHCGSSPGVPCITKTGRRAHDFHIERKAKFQTAWEYAARAATAP